MDIRDHQQTVEILPGVYRRLIDCNVDDLAMAQECEAARRELYDRAAGLLSESADHGIDIPDSIRERLSLFTGSLPELAGLVDELYELVRAICV